MTNWATERRRSSVPGAIPFECSFPYLALILTVADLILQQRKPALAEEPEMRDLVITGLAHLLSANTDIGLKHFLALGYDPDSRRRAIFCHVIARVMNAGGKFEASTDAVVTGRRTRIGEVSDPMIFCFIVISRLLAVSERL